MSRMIQPFIIQAKYRFFTHYTEGNNGCWHVYAWFHKEKFSMKIASFPCLTWRAGIEAAEEAEKLKRRLNEEWWNAGCPD